MKRKLVLLLLVSLSLGLGWAAYQTLVPRAPQLSKFVPSGALLYIQAKDFSSLLSAWNASPERQQWLTSDNYAVFSRSRLFLRLKDARDQFATAAGIPPDMQFLSGAAGTESVFALYDIGNLQFLYITRLASASAMRSSLWQARSSFETRNLAGTTFYIRKDPKSEKEVAFAFAGDYLLLATRENLLAGALQLMAGGKERSVESEPWWSQSVATAGPPGDLRMVLNLEKIVPSPYFRSYWVQQNITEMKQYFAAVSDLFRSGKEYREERVLLRKQPSETAGSDPGPQAVADLARLVPEDYGIYEVKAGPTAVACLGLLETKILAPHLGPAPAARLAPQAPSAAGEAGATSDLETRIDQAPLPRAASEQGALELKDLMEKAQVRALLQVQSTRRDQDGVFVRIHSALAFLAAGDWDERAVQAAIVEYLRPSLTAGQMGVTWQQERSGFQELDGLAPLHLAVRGKYLLVSDDAELISGLLGRLNRKTELQPAKFVAGFSHSHEHENFDRLTRAVDRPSIAAAAGETGSRRAPQFFSENINSLCRTLAQVSSESIVVRDEGGKVLQTVVYAWTQ